MGRSPSSDENGLKKGPWTPEEDEKLVKYIQKHGHGSWRALPKLAGLNRCGKSCRLRWTNYLRPDIRRGKFSQEEEETILHLHSILGNKWSAIASHLQGRTDNEIKNFWNTHLKKRLIQMGYDPMTHQPRTDLFASLPQIIALANLKDLFGRHLWDDQAATMQAEAARIARLQYQLQYLLQSPSSAVTSAPSNSFEPTSSAVGNNLLVNYSVSDSPGQGSVVDYDSLGFSQLPQLLQLPACGYTPSTATAAFTSSADPSPPSLTDSLIGGRGNNLGDALSSSTSYGGEAAPASWSDIFSTLEDPNLFHEIIP